MPDAATAARWEAVMSREFERLCRACHAGQATLLDCYGTENRGEFFAVASEVFFQDSVRMMRRHPEMYELMCAAYRQDPAGRVLRRRR
jgi:Mlc titration factor MtfA (ptsG expression regulator)